MNQDPAKILDGSLVGIGYAKAYRLQPNVVPVSNWLKYVLNSMNWAEKQLLKSVRLHTWINMPHAHWGGLVTTLGHMSWTSQSASHKTLAPIQRLFDSTIGCYLFCGDAIGPFWRFSKLLLSCFFFSGVTNCVHVRMGLQTLRWIS